MTFNQPLPFPEHSHQVPKCQRASGEDSRQVSGDTFDLICHLQSRFISSKLKGVGIYCEGKLCFYSEEAKTDLTPREKFN